MFYQFKSPRYDQSVKYAYASGEAVDRNTPMPAAVWPTRRYPATAASASAGGGGNDGPDQNGQRRGAPPLSLSNQGSRRGKRRLIIHKMFYKGSYSHFWGHNIIIAIYLEGGSKEICLPPSENPPIVR